MWSKWDSLSNVTGTVVRCQSCDSADQDYLDERSSRWYSVEGVGLTDKPQQHNEIHSRWRGKDEAD